MPFAGKKPKSHWISLGIGLLLGTLLTALSLGIPDQAGCGGSEEIDAPRPLDVEMNQASYGLGSSQPILASPIPGSTLTGTTATFSWQSDASVGAYWLYVSTIFGTAFIKDSGDIGLATSYIVSNLPTDGKPVYVRLWYRVAGLWQWEDHQYIAANLAQPVVVVSPNMVSPTPNSQLTGNSATFSWQANNTTVTEWWLYVSSVLGTAFLHDSGSLGLVTSRAVTGLPTDGRTIYVRLWYRVNSQWLYLDYQYLAANLAQPVAADPEIYSPELSIQQSDTTFLWRANNTTVSEWWLYVSTVLGTAFLYDSGSIDLNTLSELVQGLPVDGRTLYVRLWHKSWGQWHYGDFQYNSGSQGSSTSDDGTGTTSGTNTETSDDTGSVIGDEQFYCEKINQHRCERLLKKLCVKNDKACAAVGKACKRIYERRCKRIHERKYNKHYPFSDDDRDNDVDLGERD